MSTPPQETVLEPAPLQGPSRGKQITRKIISWFHIIIVTSSTVLGVLMSPLMTLVAVPLVTLVYVAESRRLRRKPDEYTRVDERLRPFNLLIVRAYLYIVVPFASLLSLAGALLLFVWAIARTFGILSWFDDDGDLETLRLRAEATSAPIPTSVPADEGLTRAKLHRGWTVVRAILSIFHVLTAITLLVFTVFAIFDSTETRRIYPGLVYIHIFAILIINAETRPFRPQRAEDGSRDPRAVAFDDLLVRGVLYQVAACLLFSAERRMSGSRLFPVDITGFVIWGIGVFFCVLWAFAKLAGFLPRLQGEVDEGPIRLEESDDSQEPAVTA